MRIGKKKMSEKIEFPAVATYEHAIITMRLIGAEYRDASKYAHVAGKFRESLHPRGPIAAKIALEFDMNVIGPEPLAVQRQFAACYKTALREYKRDRKCVGRWRALKKDCKQQKKKFMSAMSSLSTL